MARWLIGVALLAVWVGSAHAACGELAGSDTVVATREPRPTTPTTPDERAISDAERQACGPGEACGRSRHEGGAIAELSGPGFWCVMFAPAFAILMMPVGLALWLLWYLRRRRVSCDAEASEPISLLAVELIARGMQRRGGVLAAAGIAGVPFLVAMEMASMAVFATPGVIASTIVACVGLRGFFVARGMLRLIESAEPATAELIGATLILRRRDEEMHVDVSGGAIDRARRHAVPRSIATRA